MQFVIGQFYGNKQNAASNVQSGNMPAFADRPHPSEVADYSAIPDLISPIWPPDSAIDISIYVTPSIVVPSFNSKDSILVMHEKNFTIGNYSDTREIDTTIKLPKQVQHNGTLFAHFFVARTGYQLDPAAKDYNTADAVHFLRPLNQYLPKKKAKKLKNLLASSEEAEEEAVDDTPDVQTVSYYHPNFTLSVIPDSGSQKFSQMHPAVRQYVQLERTGARDKSGKNGWYYPILFLNTFWQLKTHMTELNSTVTEVPLRITLNNLSNWKFNILTSIDEGSKQSARQAAYGGPVPGGGDGSEWETIKEVLLDTNIYLLGTTGIVTILHMIFETLAFKNDIVSFDSSEIQCAILGVANMGIKFSGSLAQEEGCCRHICAYDFGECLHAGSYLPLPHGQQRQHILDDFGEPRIRYSSRSMEDYQDCQRSPAPSACQLLLFLLALRDCLRRQAQTE